MTLSKLSTRSSHPLRREGALVGIAVAAAFVFINHENLYLSQPLHLADVRIESYALATVMAYLFLRLVVIALEMSPARASSRFVRCPECGRWHDARTAAALEAHRQIELTPKPSEKEIVSAIALRKAVDAAHMPRVLTRLPGDDVANVAAPPPLNAVTRDAGALKDDPDYLERMRHSPTQPDRRLKR